MKPWPLFVSLLLACAAASAQQPPALAQVQPIIRDNADGTHFTYEYVKPKSKDLKDMYRRVRQGDLLRKLPEIQAIDGLFVLPEPLHYVMAECGEPGAEYLYATHEVVMCYEMVRVLYQRGEQLQKEQKLDADYPRRYVLANLRFILLHETGHALIDMLDIPATGREEDAVDQLATIGMQRFAGLNETPDVVYANLSMAANWFLARSTGAYNLDAYADEHELGEQRYFNMQCLIYGSDPQRYANIVAHGGLTDARAKNCPVEARKAARSWLRLLLPHVAPSLHMTEEKANATFEQRDEERNRAAAPPGYVR